MVVVTEPAKQRTFHNKYVSNKESCQQFVDKKDLHKMGKQEVTSNLYVLLASSDGKNVKRKLASMISICRLHQTVRHPPIQMKSASWLL